LGTTAWIIPDTNLAFDRQIEGYASATSINRGEAINLYVNSAEPYTVSVYRFGWYNGAGGRLVHTSTATQAGFVQPTCAHDTVTHLVECDWKNPYLLKPTDTADWPSGYYLAKLSNTVNSKESYIVFVVREDNRASDFLFQSSVTTYATYNRWSDVPNPNYDPAKPGSLKFKEFGSYTVPQSDKLSFNRPYQYYYANTDRKFKGAGYFLEWESSMVRFMEREGYDVAYNTNIDTHNNGAQLLNHKAFLSVGHDEYWTKEIRDNVEAARNAGVNLAFVGANAAYWQIRLEPGVANPAQPNRTIVAYRNNYDKDPYYALPNSDPRSLLVTQKWRDLANPRPEAALIGVQYVFNTLDRNMVISDCSSVLCNGTKSPADPTKRLQPGDILTGILGYEIDAVVPGVSPATTQIIAASPFVCFQAKDPNDPSRLVAEGNPICDGTTQYSHMTYYTAPNGAKVFATGSMQWNWGVDNSGPYPDRVNENVKQITRNVFNSFIPAPPQALSASRLKALPESGPAAASTGGGCAFSGNKTDRLDIGLLLLLAGSLAYRYQRNSKAIHRAKNSVGE
jgi:hypothetical protein